MPYTFPSPYIACSDCVLDELIPAHLCKYSKIYFDLANMPVGTSCSCCGEIKTDQIDHQKPRRLSFIALYNDAPWPTCPDAHVRHRESRQADAEYIAAFIRTYGIEAHATLTGLVRATDGYTYRDDDGMIDYGYDYVLLDPQQPDVIYEFLGY